MKALEKAAKDRDDTDAERSAATPAGTVTASATIAPDLALEPIAPPAESPVSRKQFATPSAPAAGAPQESSRAATVIQASKRESSGGMGVYVREHPLVVFGTLAALFLIAYGAYIYLQLTNPGMFVKQPPRTVQQSPSAPITSAQPPVPVTATGQLPIPLSATAFQARAEKEDRQPQSVPAAPPPASPAPVAEPPTPD